MDNAPTPAPPAAAPAMIPWSPALAATLANAGPPPGFGPPMETNSADRVGAFNPRSILRSIRRHLVAVLLLWLVGGGLLGGAAYVAVKPTFDVAAVVEVAPPAPGVFVTSNSGLDQEMYIQNQVALASNTRVFTAALAKRNDLAGLPSLRDADDFVERMRKIIKVIRDPKNSLISIGMTSADPAEAAEIVNAVVDAYLQNAEQWVDQETRRAIDRYKEMIKARELEVQARRKEIEGIATQLQGGADLDLVKDQNKLTIEQIRRLTDQKFLIELELRKAETYLKALEQRRDQDADPPDPNSVASASGGLAGGRGVATGPNPGLASDSKFNAIQEEVLMHPMVARLAAELDRARERYDKAARRARDPRNDPSTRLAREALDDLAEQYRRQVQLVGGRLAKRGYGDDEEGDNLERELFRAQVAVNQLKTSLELFETKLSEVKIDSENTGDNKTKLYFAQLEYEQAKREADAIRNQLNQLTFKAESPLPINVRSYASEVGNPRTNHRSRVLAAVPLLWGLVVVAGFVLWDARAGRVADPEEFAERTGLEVLGVVPRVPGLGQGAAPLGLPDADNLTPRLRRRLDEFAQSLDHLRVVLCQSQRLGQSGAAAYSYVGYDPSLGGGLPTGKRCVLITSAISGEGKTTVAAHLAARCASAGLRTLVIDADLRRPSLTALLGLTDAPGLTDLLSQDPLDPHADGARPRPVTIEECLRVVEPMGPGMGGHVALPSGPHQGDPGRMVQQPRLGEILGQLRDRFDIVLVDAPPLLPVPDALVVARWTQGVLLAVRHEASRHPQVERARRKLDAVRVPILGAVVNAVARNRDAESGYGSRYGGYGYGYGYGSEDIANPKPEAEPPKPEAGAAPAGGRSRRAQAGSGDGSHGSHAI